MPQDAEKSDHSLLIQELESLRRAGLTYFPRIDPAALAAGLPAPRPSAAAPTRTVSPPAAPAVRPAVVPSANVAARPAASLFENDSAMAKARSAAASPPPREAATGIPPQPLTLAQRTEHLAVLCGKVAACTRCEELAATRTKTVFGVGNPQAKILFIGEAPGADEDKQGEPFVGKAGQLLNKIIEACKLKREDVYICNVLRCRPPGNRTPSPVEAANCWEYLSGQLAIVDPEYIVCWGSVAAQTLLQTTQAIGKMRGRFLSHGRAKVLCTYHPSYLLRNPAAKKDVWEDMKFLFKDMGVTL